MSENSPGDTLADGDLNEFQKQRIASHGSDSLLVGNYVLVGRLGRGGMATVFQATCRTTGRVVAIKSLDDRRVSEVESHRRFEREIKIARELDHPSIARSLDVVESRGTLWLVMDFVEGSNLREYVEENGPVDTDLAVEWMRQAATGLELAHRHGLIHRDVKPSNLMIDNQARIRLLDFGVARIDASGATDDTARTELTATGQVVGTADYMAPEQMLNSREVDSRADLYSLGCCLHYLINGEPPYRRLTIIETMLAHTEDPIPSLGASGSWIERRTLRRIYRRLMAKKPGQRWNSATDVVKALVDHQTGGPTRRIRRRVAAGLMAMTLGAMLIALWMNRESVYEIFDVPSVQETANMLVEPGEALTSPQAADYWYRSNLDRQIQGAAAYELSGVFPVPPMLADGSVWQLAFRSPRGHIDDSSWSSDGQELFMVESHGPVRCYDVRTRRLNWIRRIHPSVVTRIEAQPQGDLIATAHADRVVRLWNSSLELLVELPNAAGASIQQIQWSPDGRQLAIAAGNVVHVGSDDGTAVATRDVSSHVRDMSWSPDGSELVIARGQVGVVIWSPASGASRNLTVDSSDPVYTAAWSPDASRIAVGLASGTLYLVDPLGDDDATEMEEKHSGRVVRLRWSPDGQFLASAAQDSRMILWYPNGERRTYVTMNGWPRNIHWNPRGTSLFIEMDLGHRVFEITGETTWQLADALPHTIRGLDWHPDGTRVLGAARNRMTYEWSHDGRHVKRVHTHADGALSVKWSVDGTHFVSSGPTAEYLCRADGQILRVVRSDKPVYTKTVTWHPDGVRFAVNEDKRIRIVDRIEGRDQFLVADNLYTSGVQWSPDGERIAAYGTAIEGSSPLRLWSGDGQTEFDVGLKWDKVTAVAWGKDSTQLAAVNWGNPVHIFNRDGQPETQLDVVGPNLLWHAGTANSAANWLVTGEARRIRITSLERSEAIATLPNRSRTVAFALTGADSLVTGSVDGVVVAWFASTGTVRWVSILVDNTNVVTFDAHGRIICGDGRNLLDTTVVLVRDKTGTIQQVDPYKFFYEQGYSLTPQTIAETQ